MLFNSWEFIAVFLPLTLLGFLVLGRWCAPRVALAWLTLASLIFYGFWNPTYLLLLGTSMIINYAFGRVLTRRPHKQWLFIGIAFNVALIAYFKYSNFVVGMLPPGWAFVAEWKAVVLPLAISFFTFQQIAYLVDAWQGRCHEYRFADYCLFVSFFPQLIAGPIVHHREMMPQLQRERLGIDPAFAARGATWFIIGLFKKVVVADGVARYGSPVFDAVRDGAQPTLFEAWGGTLAYTCQIYFDFSGYSDMAIGLALLFGVRLPFNFDSPYKAASISEFWRKWHMTLSRFLRDYLYIPLGGNRRGRMRHAVNLLLTMLLGGLWHGAAFTFILWGGLHGLYLVIHHVWQRSGLARFSGRRMGMITTFVAVAVSWVIFRSDNLETAWRMVRGMFGFYGVSLSDSVTTSLGFLRTIGVRFDGMGSFDSDGLLWIILCLVPIFLAPNSQQIMGEQPSTSRLRWRPCIVHAMACALLLVWSLLQLSQASEFLYFNF